MTQYYDADSLPTEVKDLFALFENFNIAQEQGRYTNDHNKYRGLLETIRTKYSDLDDPNIQVAMALHMLKRLSFRLNHPGRDIMPSPMLGLTCKFLYKSGLLPKLRGDVELAHMIACVSTKVALHRNTAGMRDAQYLHDVLSVWLDRRIELEEVETIEKTIGFIYGEAAWHLYREEVGRLEQLPEHLWRLRIPPSALLGAKGYTTDLPTEMDM